MPTTVKIQAVSPACFGIHPTLEAAVKSTVNPIPNCIIVARVTGIFSMEYRILGAPKPSPVTAHAIAIFVKE